MSIAGIATTAFSQLANVKSNFHKVQSEFKNLGEDLSSADLTKAQTDFVTLSQSAASTLAGNSTVAKALNSVGQALQSGDLAGAQKALANMPPIPIWTDVRGKILGNNPPGPGGHGGHISPAVSGISVLA